MYCILLLVNIAFSLYDCIDYYFFISIIRIYLYISGLFMYFFFFKQKTAYEMPIIDWSSDGCSSDLLDHHQCRCAGDAGLLRSRRRSRQFPDSRQGPADVATAGSPGFPELSVPVAAWLQVDHVARFVVPGFGQRLQRPLVFVITQQKDLREIGRAHV